MPLKQILTILSPFVHDRWHNDVAGDATGKALYATGKADVASTTEHPHTRTGDMSNDAHSATTGRNADVGQKADVAFEATGTGDDDASTGRAVSYDATYAHDAYAHVADLSAASACSSRTSVCVRGLGGVFLCV